MPARQRVTRSHTRRSLLATTLLLGGIALIPSSLAAQDAAAPADTAAKAKPKPAMQGMQINQAQICAMLRNSIAQMQSGKAGGQGGVQLRSAPANSTAKADSASAAPSATPAAPPAGTAQAAAPKADSAAGNNAQAPQSPVKAEMKLPGGQTQSITC